MFSTETLLVALDHVGSRVYGGGIRRLLSYEKHLVLLAGREECAEDLQALIPLGRTLSQLTPIFGNGLATRLYGYGYGDIGKKGSPHRFIFLTPAGCEEAYAAVDDFRKHVPLALGPSRRVQARQAAKRVARAFDKGDASVRAAWPEIHSSMLRERVPIVNARGLSGCTVRAQIALEAWRQQFAQDPAAILLYAVILCRAKNEELALYRVSKGCRGAHVSRNPTSAMLRTRALITPFKKGSLRTMTPEGERFLGEYLHRVAQIAGRIELGRLRQLRAFFHAPRSVRVFGASDDPSSYVVTSSRPPQDDRRIVAKQVHLF